MEAHVLEPRQGEGCAALVLGALRLGLLLALDLRVQLRQRAQESLHDIQSHQRYTITTHSPKLVQFY